MERRFKKIGKLKGKEDPKEDKKALEDEETKKKWTKHQRPKF